MPQNFFFKRMGKLKLRGEAADTVTDKHSGELAGIIQFANISDTATAHVTASIKL